MGNTKESAGKIALILEGGSLREQFSAGVLDVFLENGIEVDACYAVSAGTLAGLSFKSRQIGRYCRDNLALRDESRYMGGKAVLEQGSVIGYDFYINDLQGRIDPMDNEAFLANPMPLYAVVTDMTFGTADFLEIQNAELDLIYAQASTSMPLVTQPVEIDGHIYMDGGVADSVPIEHALEDVGFERAIVILTQHREYEKQPYAYMSAARAAYPQYPYFLKALETRHNRYNEQRKHIWAYEEEGRALVIAPEKPVEVSHLERDGQKLLELYIQGRQQAAKRLDEVREFIS